MCAGTGVVGVRETQQLNEIVCKIEKLNPREDILSSFDFERFWEEIKTDILKSIQEDLLPVAILKDGKIFKKTELKAKEIRPFLIVPEVVNEMKWIAGNKLDEVIIKNHNAKLICKSPVIYEVEK